MTSSRELPHYRDESFLTAALGNNAFDYDERASLHPEPYLRLAPLRQYGSAAEAFADLRWSTIPAFEVIEEGRLKSFAGLENFLLFPSPASLPAETPTDTNPGHLPQSPHNLPHRPVFIFDNHNHAFYFWHVCLHGGLRNRSRRTTPTTPGVETTQTTTTATIAPNGDTAPTPPFTLIHIDQHKDTRIPATLPDSDTISDTDALYAYTNEILNVGNFIPPALKTGLLDRVINIDSSTSLQAARAAAPPENFILDLDLDFFAPELDYIPRAAKISLLKKLLSAARLVTIATSPYFLDQQKVPDLLREIFT